MEHMPQPEAMPGKQLDIFADSPELQAQKIREILNRPDFPFKVYDPRSVEVAVMHINKELDEKQLGNNYKAVYAHSSYHDQHGYPYLITIESRNKEKSKESFWDRLKKITQN